MLAQNIRMKGIFWTFFQFIYVPVYRKIETQQLLTAIFRTDDKSDCKLFLMIINIVYWWYFVWCGVYYLRPHEWANACACTWVVCM